MLAKTDDPVVEWEKWFPISHELHTKVVAETPDFDYIRLSKHNPTLYDQIKLVENLIDRMGPAKVSEVMSLVRQWRELVTIAMFDQQNAAG